MELALGILILVALCWCAFWGGVGYLLATQRGASGGRGLAWGALLGPVGLLVIVWFTRRSAASRRHLRDVVLDLTDDPGDASLHDQSEWGVGPARRERSIPSSDPWS